MPLSKSCSTNLSIQYYYDVASFTARIKVVMAQKQRLGSEKVKKLSNIFIKMFDRLYAASAQNI
jgi:hypothetical protein